MNREVKQKWIAALRSGKYKQTTGMLKRSYGEESNSYCCLGVLCELYRLETGEGNWDGISFNGQTGIPPISVGLWAGLDDTNPVVGIHKDGFTPKSIAEFNDNGCTFEQVADLIEQKL